MPIGMASPGFAMRLTACAQHMTAAPDAIDAGMK